ncbi:MAG TPA: hypothetical protein VG962_04270 [Steroidobacteraceae bacterium]|nr:hypothetical protein [Steroidobacteraceae bacterium]
MTKIATVRALFCTWIIALLACLFISTAEAAVLVNEAHVVAANDGLAASLPAAKSFDVNTAGDYTVTLTDVGNQSGGASKFTSLSLVIYQGSQLMKLVSVPEATDVTASAVVTLAAGTYSAQILGTTTGASLYSVTISNNSTTVLSLAGSMTADSNAGGNSNFASLQTALNLVTGHNYTVTLNDLAFPAALASLQSSIAVDNTSPQCRLTWPATTTCSFVAGTTNQLLALASKAGNAVAGMYSIKIVDNTDGSVNLASVYPVGAIPDPVAVPLPANGSYQIVTTDLKTPDALTNLQTMLLQDVTVLANQNAAGTSQTNDFTAVAGSAKLYLLGNSGANGGVYGVQISQGSSVVYSKAGVISPNAVTQTGYYFNVTLPAAGSYALKLTDINFPQPFTTLSATVTQSGVSLGSTDSTGALTISNAAAGDLQIFVIATPVSNSQGLFGVTLNAGGSNTALLNVTQGVGGAFVAIPVNVTSAGTYKLSVNDMAAPQLLGQLLVAVTHDSQFAGEVIGSGSVGIDATTGNYVLNVIANTNTTANTPFGMYGIAFGSAPTVTFTASAMSVKSGGNVTLTWNSTDADSCVASDGWSGNKATSGSESFGPINADAKLTLTCSGVSGSASQSVTVKIDNTVDPSSTKSGGGGALQWWLLYGMLLLAVCRFQALRRPVR